MSKSPLEETVEDYLVKRVEAIGGVALKGDVKGRRFLDRICILPGGVTVYVEVKRPSGGRYSKHQVETLKRLQALGHKVARVENRAEVDGFIWAANPAPSDHVVPTGYVLVPIKPTKEMAYEAACSHYGRKRVERAGGIEGIDMTVDSYNYDFWRAFRKFWRGAIAHAPQPAASEGSAE